MRTTIKLDDDVFRAYKQRAAERGTTFAHEVEEVLRSDLQSRRSARPRKRYEVPVFRGGRGALIDIDDNKAIDDLFLEEEGWIKRDDPV